MEQSTYDLMKNISERLTRMESRLVKLMLHSGMDSTDVQTKRRSEPNFNRHGANVNVDPRSLFDREAKPRRRTYSSR